MDRIEPPLASEHTRAGGYGIGLVANGRAIVQPDGGRFVVKVEAANVVPVQSARMDEFVLQRLEAPGDATPD